MNLPKPRIKATKKIGDTLVHKLAWGAEGGGEWLEDDWFATMSEDLTPETTNVTCNTRKSRDKRERRHTVGVFIGAFPCGVIVIGKTGAKSHKTFVRNGISLNAQDLLKNYTQKTGFQRDFSKCFPRQLQTYNGRISMISKCAKNWIIFPMFLIFANIQIHIA